MSVIIGIDLGTTNFAVCTIENGRPKLLQDGHQNRTFPSAIFRKNDQWIVGHAAKSSRLKNPKRGAYAVKRLMGVKYDSKEREALEETLGLKLSPQENGEIQIEIGGEMITPAQVAAKILEFCRELTIENIGEAPDIAVITVPAYFNHAQREATKRAAEIAGLPCDRIINEPTAAAVAYGMKAKENSTVLVFDLGGGTFDVSILKFSNGIVETLATCGDSFLGGEDFDQLIVEMLIKDFNVQYSEELILDFVVKQRLKDAAEIAKIELSQQRTTIVFLPSLSDGRDLQVSLSRADFEEASRPLVQKSLDVLTVALSDSGLTSDDIDQYLLVGGQTRMPLVQDELIKFFHKKPQKSVHPDEVVAIGAALHASSLNGETDAPMLFDVTPFDLGIEVQGGLFQTIISKNSKVPTSATKTFLVREKQDSVRVVVRQGHSRFSNENEFLGEFSVNKLNARDDGKAELEVRFRIDANGMLSVTAKDVVSGRKVNLKMRNYGEFIRDAAEDDESAVIPKETLKPSYTATVGVGDSSASGSGSDDGQFDLEEKEKSLEQMEEVPSSQELEIANSLVEDTGFSLDVIEDDDVAFDESKIEEEMAYLSSIVGESDTKPEPEPEVKDKSEVKDEGLMDLDLSWLNQLEDSEERTAKVEEVVLDPEAEPESEEPVFELLPESVVIEEEDEDVFELVLEPTPEVSAPKVTTPSKALEPSAVNDLLDKLLFSGFEEHIEIPEDDFFHGLTAIVTGKASNTKAVEQEDAQIIIELEEREDLKGLSSEMQKILVELFA